MHAHPQHHDHDDLKTETCCHGTAAEAAQRAPSHHASHAHGHAHSATSASTWRLAASATVHCLTGCAIGEFVGLAIGVSLGLGTWATIVLATALSYASGFALGLLPLVRRGMRLREAFAAIWVGEAISIAVMEIAMNYADYRMGGMAANSMLDPMFWIGFLVALPAGFLAAWPVNWWLLRRNIKAHCH